jgi:hypothetical protein
MRLYWILKMDTGAMAKQAARRKLRAKREADWPETAGANDSTAVAVTAGDLARIGAARAGKRDARGTAIGAERDAAVAMGEALASGFKSAVAAAIRDAHAEGFAVPARLDGVAVEIRPNGEAVPIDDKVSWSPAAWRKAAAR